jgi:hypothetical protein
MMGHQGNEQDKSSTPSTLMIMFPARTCCAAFIATSSSTDFASISLCTTVIQVDLLSTQSS